MTFACGHSRSTRPAGGVFAQLRAPARSLVFGSILTALALSAALPQSAAAQTLNEALSTAYRSNPTIQAARAELRTVNEQVPQALSNWRPGSP